MTSSKFWYSVSNFFKSIEILGVSIYLSRTIENKSTLGQLLQVIFISSVIVTIVSAAPLALNYFYGRAMDSKEKNKLIFKLIFLIFCVVLIFIALYLLSAKYISGIFNSNLLLIYKYSIVIFVGLKALNSIFPNYHYLNSNIKNYIVFYLISLVSIFICFTAVENYNYLDARLIIEILIFTELVRLLFNVSKLKFISITFKDLLFNRFDFRYILTISIGILLGAVSLFGDKYLVSAMLSPTEFAFYQNGAINLPFVNIITSSLFITMIPEFVALNRNNVKILLLNKTKKTVLKCCILLLPILVYSFFESKALIVFIYGDEFLQSSMVFKIYLLKFSLGVMAYSIYMNAIGLEKNVNLIVLINAIVCVITNLFLIPIWGINGAAIATSFSSLITVFLSLHIVSKKLKYPIGMFFPIKRYFYVLILSVVLYIPFGIMNYYFKLELFVVIFSAFYYLIALYLINLKLEAFDFKKIIKL